MGQEQYCFAHSGLLIMTFAKTTIANRTYDLHHLNGGMILEIAKLPKKYNEAMLTKGLQCITGQSETPRNMTTQERYALYLKYLLSVQDHNIAPSINIESFLNDDLQTLHRERIEENGISARCLIGIEAEALETGCETTVDWILGAMSLQIGCEKLDLPPLDIQVNEISFIQNTIKNRLSHILSLEQPVLNDLCSQFFELDKRLNTLVKITYDNGIVLNKFGGTDDAPTRFRINAAITGIAKQLFSIAVGENAAI